MGSKTIVTSIEGRRLGLDESGTLVGNRYNGNEYWLDETNMLTAAQAAAAWKVPSLLTASVATTFAAAIANSQAIASFFTANARGVTVSILPGMGPIPIGTRIRIPSECKLIVGQGSFLQRYGSSTAYTFVSNWYAQGGAYVSGLIITNGTLTIPETGHPYSPGDNIFMAGFTGNASLNGPQTVLSTVPGVSFTIKAAGANPTNAATALAYSSPYYPISGVNFTRPSGTVTISFPGGGAAGVVTWPGNICVKDTQIQFTTTGALPAPLVANTTYYVISLFVTPNNNTFEIAATKQGTPIVTTNAGSGVHTAYAAIVQVQEPGHAREAGDPVYIDALADATFTGAQEIVLTSRGAWWAYNTAWSANTAPAGTAQVLGDYGIEYDLALDGNSDAAGHSGNLWGNVCAKFGNVGRMTGRIRDGLRQEAGSICYHYNVKGANFPEVRVRDGAGGAIQFDSYCDRIHIGAVDCVWGIDDIVAWGVTTAGGSYTDTVPPCGPGNMGSLVVDSIQGYSPTSLFKLYCGAGYNVGDIRIGKVSGTGGIALGDPTPGVSGGAWNSVIIDDCSSVLPLSGGCVIATPHGSFSGGMGLLHIGVLQDNQPNPAVVNGGEALALDGPITTVSIGRLIAKVNRTSTSGAVKMATNVAGSVLKIGSIESTGSNNTGYVLLTRSNGIDTVDFDTLSYESWTHNGSANAGGDLIYSDTGVVWINVFGGKARIVGVDRFIATNTAGKTHNWHLGEITVDTTAIVVGSAVSGTYNIDWTMLNTPNPAGGIYYNAVRFNSAGQVVSIKAGSTLIKSSSGNQSSCGVYLDGGSATFSIDADPGFPVDLGAAPTVTPNAQIVLTPGNRVWNSDATNGGYYGVNAAGTAFAKIY